MLESPIRLEQGLLSEALLYPNKAYQIIAKLDSTDFQEESHQAIFEAIKSCCQKGLEPESTIVFEELKKNRHAHLLQYTSELTEVHISLPNVDYACERIIKNTAKSKLHAVSRDLYDETQDDTKDVDDILSKHLNDISILAPKEKHTANSSESVDRFLKEQEQRKTLTTEFVGTPFGVSSLDNFTKGVRKTAMATVAAGTGSGKTYFCLNMAIHNAQQGKKIAYFSLEMTDVELMYRTLPMLITNEKIKPDRIEDINLNSDEQKDLQSLLDKYKALDFHVDWGTRDVNKILFTCESIRRSSGLDLIFIDHLQLLHGANDYGKFCENTGKIKAYALQNQIPIVCASQLNRQFAGRANKMPVLSDLRGSGSIEQDSDTIIFLHKENKEDKHTYLIVGKHRQATTAVGFSRELMFNPINNKLVEQLGTYSIPKKQKYPTNQANPYEDLDF